MPHIIMVWTFGDILFAAFAICGLLLGALFILALGYEKAKRATRKMFSDFLKGRK